LRDAELIQAYHRSFLKKPGHPNIPIQAIGLSLYEALGSDPVEQPGTKVTRTQWLDLSSLEMANLIGKNVLIVDEVDDTRTTLEYAVRELEKDVQEAQRKAGRESEKTSFSIFVLHNKDKPKKGQLPPSITEGKYHAARTVGDVWICYPWEATYVSNPISRSLRANVVSGTLMSTTACPESKTRNKSRATGLQLHVNTMSIQIKLTQPKLRSRWVNLRSNIKSI
jgi:hypoxanthine phosphoribosyltransferase